MDEGREGAGEDQLRKKSGVILTYSKRFGVRESLQPLPPRIITVQHYLGETYCPTLPPSLPFLDFPWLFPPGPLTPPPFPPSAFGFCAPEGVGKSQRKLGDY